MAGQRTLRRALLGSVFALGGDGGADLPSLRFDAALGVLPSGFTCTRASKGTYWDANGVLQEAANNVPRFDYDPVTKVLRGLLIEEQRTNSVADPRFENTSGPYGLPTGWGGYLPGGLTLTLVGRGTEFGMSYVDLRYSGTATGTGAHNFSPPNVAAAPGQSWSYSIGARIVGGSKTNVSEVSVRPTVADGAAAYLAEVSTNFVAALSSTFQRFSCKYNNLPVNTAWIGGPITLRATGAVAVDITIRWYIPQLEQGAFPTSPILPPVGSPAASTRAADVVVSSTSSWWNPAEGTFAARYTPAIPVGGSTRMAVSVGTTTAEGAFIGSNGTTDARLVLVKASVASATATASRAAGAEIASSAGWNAASAVVAANGVLGSAVVPTGLPVIPTPTVRFGGSNWSGAENNQLNGWVRYFAYYPRRLPDATLIALSQPQPYFDWQAESLTLPPGFTIARASKGTYFGSDGVLQEAANDTARFDYDPETLALKGLLIEVQRTNHLANSRFEGATVGVIGSGGVAPSGMSMNSPMEILGVGTEDGIPYMDVRIQSASALSIMAITYNVLQAGASPGQAWTQSHFVRLLAGSLTNFTVQTSMYFNGGGITATAITPTNAPLRTQRYTDTQTAPAGTTSVGARFRISASDACDATFRIGLPQLEIGPWASSPILPPVGSPAASTRAMDVVACNGAASWVGALESTVLCEAEHSFSDGTARQHRYFAFAKAPGTVENYQAHVQNNSVVQNVFSGGASQVFGGPAATWPGSKRVAAAFKQNDFAISVNGGAPVADTAGNMPTGIDTVYLGIGESGGNWPLDGWLKRFAYYPIRLSNAKLQEISL